MRVIGCNIFYDVLMGALEYGDNADGARACLHALGGLMGEW